MTTKTQDKILEEALKRLKEKLIKQNDKDRRRNDRQILKGN
ncbi:hypothetical protein [Pseudoalteromonas sp.]|nr:hypothetical protein [Pseudoalteromonas sp.]